MRGPGKSGHALLELALLSPWLFFLFAGVFDVGMYTVALQSAENAARVGALYTASSSGAAADSAGACQYALEELKTMANVRSLTTCSSAPLVVTAAAITGVDGAPASRVTVAYTTPLLIPLPFLPGRVTITRSADVRVNQ